MWAAIPYMYFILIITIETNPVKYYFSVILVLRKHMS